MSVRGVVCCSQCGASISRVLWNYAKARPITEFFCNNVCKASWQRGQREALGYTRAWLETEYIENRKGADQIAREIGRDPKRVWEWIRDYGIPRRPRGTDYGNGFIKGQTSLFKGHKHTQEAKDAVRAKRLEDGHVPYMKNGKHWLKHPGAVSPAWRGGVTPERQALYSSDAWKVAVKGVWARDLGICQRCGKSHNEGHRGKFAIHHMIPFTYRPTRSDVDNLILVCRQCHLWIHSKKNQLKDFIQEVPNV